MITLVEHGDKSALAVSAYVVMLFLVWLVNHRDNVRRIRRRRR